MAHTLFEGGDPYIAASAINPYEAVVFASGSPEKVMPARAATGFMPGLALQATAPSPGNPIAIQGFGRAKAIAAASIGAGQLVTSGANASGLVAFTPAAATAGNPQRYVIGVALENANPGSIFTVDIRPHACL